MRIACILPRKEGFSPLHAGAIALCVRDNIAHSRHQGETYVIGGATSESFASIAYYPALTPKRWYETQSRSYARQSIDILKQHPAHLIEVHNRPSLAAAIAHAIGDTAVALHLHNDPQHIRATGTARKRWLLAQKLRAVYCVSHFVRNQFLAGLPQEAAAKVHVVYNGLMLPATLPLKAKTIVFVGRMTQEKGALPLAQALNRVLPQFPQWRAVFIGSKRHALSQALSPYERAVLTALKPIENQTEFTGFISHTETMEYVAQAEIAVVPSVWNEPFGRTALEALACKCALISSDRGGLKEVIGNTALIPRDITQTELAACLFLLLSDDAKRAALQQAAQAQAAHFSIADTTRTLDDIRDTLMKESIRL